MTPLKAAEILESWAKNAKTAESREVCEMAAIGMRNSAMTREILAASGAGEVIIHVLQDGSVELFMARTRNGPTVGGTTLTDTLTALLEKVSKG